MDEKNKFEGTLVDLGEDLLEPTPHAIARPDAAPASKPSAPESYNVAEEIQKGEILFTERLFDEAKKVCRKVLRREPGNERATKVLAEIQKLEIHDLLSVESSRKRLGAPPETDSPAQVLERLEKELRLGLDKAEIRPVPDLFESQWAFDRYRERAVETTAKLSNRDRIDVGIAHLEMGLYDVAQAIFETVVRHEDDRISGMYLLGLSLIFGGKAIEATIRLEPLCRDLTLDEGVKTDFLYLMGLAFERLGDTRKAREFFRRVFLLNPRYRDVPDKLK